MKKARNPGIKLDEHGNWITGDPEFDSKYSIVGGDPDEIFYVDKDPSAPDKPVSFMQAAIRSHQASKK